MAAGTSTRRKTIYSLALRKFGKQVEAEDDVLRTLCKWLNAVDGLL